MSRPVEPRDEGGDPACWLPRVCPECGTLADEDPPTRCPSCGAELPGESIVPGGWQATGE